MFIVLRGTTFSLLTVLVSGGGNVSTQHLISLSVNLGCSGAICIYFNGYQRVFSTVLES